MRGRRWPPRSPYRMPSHSRYRMSSHNPSRMPSHSPSRMPAQIPDRMPKPKLDPCKSTDRSSTCEMRGQTKIFERSSGGNKLHGFSSGPHKMPEPKMPEPKISELKISEHKMPEHRSRPCKMFAHLRSWKASVSATSVLASRHFASFRRDQR